MQLQQKTININGYEVPEPCREHLKYGTGYYIPNISCDIRFENTTWLDDRLDDKYLKLGLIHLTEEAAISHSEALLSFTKQNAERKPSVDWAEVPSGYDWLAVDEDGNGYVFPARPAINKNIDEV